MQYLGHTRSAHRADHILQTPDTFVRAPLPGMQRATAIVHVAPASGARFTQYTAELEAGGSLGPTTLQRFVYVLDGELAHKDSMGNGSTIRPGDVQRMSAGSGVRHSEFNPSSSNPVHFLQIWIQPNAQGMEPSYEEKQFSVQEKRGRLRIIASPDQVDGSVLIHQDARVYAGLFDGTESATLNVKPGRTLYVHVARGTVTANGTVLSNGDALKLTDTEELALQQGQQAEVLVFDLPK